MTVVPATIKAEQILNLELDGVVISAGAGNPADYESIAAEIREIANKRIPMFGIGLGHQLLAMSQGADTAKLPYGHRGGNQPIEDSRPVCATLPARTTATRWTRRPCPPTLPCAL